MSYSQDGFDAERFVEYMYNLFMPRGSIEVSDIENLKTEQVIEKVFEIAMKIYNGKEERIGSDRMREVERVVLLQAVDSHWIDHIDAIEQLKKGIGLLAAGQKDPVKEFTVQSFDMFDDINKNINKDALKHLFA